MIRPNRRARDIMAATLSTAFATTLLLAAAGASAQSCPTNFFSVLESKAQTTAAKQDIGNICRGRDVTVRGTVLDIAKQGDTYELHIASTASGNRIRVIMRDPPGGDLTKLRKGTVVSIAATFRDFTGMRDEYVTLEDGTCKNCLR